MTSPQEHARRFALDCFAEGFGWEDAWVQFTRSSDFPKDDADRAEAFNEILAIWRAYHGVVSGKAA